MHSRVQIRGHKSERRKDDAKHVCQLASEEDVLVIFIHDGHFVLLRRMIKSLFIINSNNYYTKMCFKSSYLIHKERLNHLKSNYYMIHPFSRAR